MPITACRKKCARCAEVKGPEEYVCVDGSTSRKCKRCRQIDAIEKKKARQWTWCKGLACEAEKRAQAEGPRAHDEFVLGISRNPGIIEALAVTQGNNCAVTGWKFYFPSGEETSGLDCRSSIQRWRDRLQPVLRHRTPALVKIVPEDGWQLGNTMLMLYGLRNEYEKHGGLVEWRSFCRHIADRNMELPTKDGVLAVMARLAEERA